MFTASYLQNKKKGTCLSAAEGSSLKVRGQDSNLYFTSPLSPGTYFIKKLPQKEGKVKAYYKPMHKNLINPLRCVTKILLSEG